MANILFTSTGTGGDVLPLLRIGRRLRERGHAVHLLTHACYAGRAAAAGLGFAALDDAAEYARFIDDGPLLNTPAGIPEFLRRHCFPRLTREFALIEQRYRPGDTILVARDFFDVGARAAAERLGIPLSWVFMAPSQLQHGALRRALFARILAPDVDRFRAEVGLGPVADWDSWLSYPGRNPALWAGWFAAPDPAWPAEVVPVGFVLDNEGESGEVPEAIMAMAGGGAPPVLITGGTGTYPGAGFHDAAAQACRRIGRPAVLVTSHDRLVPSGLPASTLRYGYLPLGTVMPLMGAVVHHGGRGTLSCALAAGTPQVVLAWGADRPDNAMRLEQLGVAKYVPLPSWNAERVADALLQIADSATVRERCRELACRIAATDSLTEACRVIEDAHP
jgi:UDP:flavonoid glycosyltransferase YjiC (YdhE family)